MTFIVPMGYGMAKWLTGFKPLVKSLLQSLVLRWVTTLVFSNSAGPVPTSSNRWRKTLVTHKSGHVRCSNNGAPT